MQAGWDYPGVAVVMICHDGAGHILIARRGPGARNEHGVWEIPGGGVEFGEQVEEALKREVVEEFSAHIKNARFLGYRDSLQPRDGRKSHWIALDFLIELDPQEVKIGELDKCDEIRWVQYGDWPENFHAASPSTIEARKDILSKL